MVRSSGTSADRRQRAIEAVASPVRQEIIDALALGPATIRELAARLGRSRQSLYYHLAALESAAIARVAAWRGEGRERERVYRVERRPIEARGRRASPGHRAASERAVRAMLRLTMREVAAAVHAEPTTAGPAVAFRGKAHLSVAKMKKLQTSMREIIALLEAGREPRLGRRLVAVTVVVAPVRIATAPRARRRAAR